MRLMVLHCMTLEWIEIGWILEMWRTLNQYVAMLSIMDDMLKEIDLRSVHCA